MLNIGLAYYWLAALLRFIQGQAKGGGSRSGGRQGTERESGGGGEGARSSERGVTFRLLCPLVSERFGKS